VREQLAQAASQLGVEAEQVTAEFEQATSAGDARSARALLERQRELLDRIEAANIELRTVRDFETALLRQTTALQRAVDGLRVAKESAKAEIALARAERMPDPEPESEREPKSEPESEPGTEA
jgi:chromosome segregation ATPase